MYQFYQPKAPSAEVEMTSYMLLAYLTAQPIPTPEDLTSASHIVKWIIKQQIIKEASPLLRSVVSKMPNGKSDQKYMQEKENKILLYYKRFF